GAALPDEEAGADLLLQHLNVLGYARLGRRLSRSRSGERALLVDGDKGADLPEGKAHYYVS
ncbi:MAG: hypothetical protein JWN94_2998, partial [Betaproteobacteria bacterium]|nr:hypothetical protein [Betaproteobacteria bacterium]